MYVGVRTGTTHMNWVTLVTLVYSLQKEVHWRRRRGEERKVEGRKNYYHPVPSPLIKSITSNMFLMMVKAGGNWFIWRCFKVNFSQVERGSLKPCVCVCVCVRVCMWDGMFMSLGLTLMLVRLKKAKRAAAISRQMLSWPPQVVCVCVYLLVCVILLLTYFSQYKLKLLTPAVSTPVTCKANLLVWLSKCENEEELDRLHIRKNIHRMPNN